MPDRIAVQESTHGACVPQGIQPSPAIVIPQVVGSTQQMPNGSFGQTGTGPSSWSTPQKLPLGQSACVGPPQVTAFASHSPGVANETPFLVLKQSLK
jgi:hypothetical protein